MSQRKGTLETLITWGVWAFYSGAIRGLAGTHDNCKPDLLKAPLLCGTSGIERTEGKAFGGGLNSLCKMPLSPCCPQGLYSRNTSRRTELGLSVKVSSGCPSRPETEQFFRWAHVQLMPKGHQWLQTRPGYLHNCKVVTNSGGNISFLIPHYNFP